MQEKTRESAFPTIELQLPSEEELGTNFIYINSRVGATSLPRFPVSALRLELKFKVDCSGAPSFVPQLPIYYWRGDRPTNDQQQVTM